MKTLEKVSILTPCYNTGRYIHRLLDSILQQDYPNIEMFIIDDGSTDDSADVIKSYIPKFKNRNYELFYLYQENQGQSVAIANGLKYISGDYLIWPDSDDWYNSHDSISILVNELKKAPNNVAIVRGQQLYVSEKDYSITGHSGNNFNNDDSQLFHDCLFVRNGFWFASGGCMVKVSVLRKVTNFDIYAEKNAGQNWQLMLPILYSYKCKTISDPIICILERHDSHSRGQYKSYNQKLERLNSYERTLLGTLDRICAMDFETKQSLSSQIKKKYLNERISLACTYNKYNEIWHYHHQLKNDGGKIGIKRMIRLLKSVLHIRERLGRIKRLIMR